MRTIRFVPATALTTTSALLALLALLALGACTPSSSSDSTTTPAGTDGGVTVTDTCPSPSGAGTTHGSSLAGDETWTAAASPHILDSSLSIAAGQTLTLEACAVVQLGDGADVNVDGKLVAAGTNGKPVKIGPLDASKPWGWIDGTRTVVKPPIDLAYTIVSGGGKTTTGVPEAQSMVRVRASLGGPATGMIKVDHVELRDSGSVGILLVEGSAFADGSQALTVTGSKLEPVAMGVYGLSSLPDGSYKGNTVDRIVLTTAERLGINGQTVDATMHARDVPYRLGYGGDTSQLLIGPASGGGTATLTLEAGTTFTFQKGFSLDLRAQSDLLVGSIVALGSAAAPITFTSDAATPAAGDWGGIFVRGVPPAAMKLDHVVIEYAGNQDTQTNGFSCGTPTAPIPKTNMGALVFATSGAVTTELLTNSVIRDSASNGVDRGWKGAPVDYTATNTFTRIAYCTQTDNQPTVGLCAAVPACPAGN